MGPSMSQTIPVSLIGPPRPLRRSGPVPALCPRGNPAGPGGKGRTGGQRSGAGAGQGHGRARGPSERHGLAPHNTGEQRETPRNTGEHRGPAGEAARARPGGAAEQRSPRGEARPARDRAGGDTKTPRVRGFLEGKQAKAEIPRLEGGRGWKGFLFPAPKGAPGALRGSLVKGVECGTKGDGCELQEGRFMWDFGEEIPPCDGKEGLAQVSSWLSHPWQCPGPAWPGLGAAEIMDGVPAHPWRILGPFPNHLSIL